jgi:cysteine synthase
MDNKNRWYLAGAFFLGVLFTLGYKDVYPDLEARFRRRQHRGSLPFGRQKVELKDATKESTTEPDGDVPEGIEGCIGNTPLFKICSLSEATGCEILAKAEVLVNICP